jgi:hypothetical protein
MRKLFMPILASLIAAALTAGIAVASRLDDDGRTNDRNFQYAIGVWGDLPYSDIQQNVGIPNLIADMNAQNLAFTADDGDLKQGSNSPCDDALYTRALGWFNSLRAPAIFTPGDNDWTDCDRASNGGFNSRERLDHERQVFFSTPFTLGMHRLRQEVQTDKLCINAAGEPTACVENRRWTYKDVTYATLNVQGSCNNLCDTPATGDPQEWAARNEANIAWLRQTFAEATKLGSAAVMLIAQADPGFDLSDGTRAPLRDPKTLAEIAPIGGGDGYVKYLNALRDEVIKFQRPVAYVHGDSHYFRIDKPLQNSTGQRIENFTRVETFGDHQENGLNDVHWLKVLVDPKTREVFAYEPQIVPGNRVAVPAP